MGIEAGQLQKRAHDRVIWQLCAAAVGVVVMALPELLDLGGRLAELDWIVGPIIISIAIISAAEVTRSLRWVNVISAIVLLAGGLIWGTQVSLLIHMALALALALLSVPRGPRRQSFGSGWRGLFQSPSSTREDVGS